MDRNGFDRGDAQLTILNGLVQSLVRLNISGSPAIPWSSPVPFFGDVSRSSIATVGINPSNREFVDENGNPLSGRSRRLETLSSLDLSDWSLAHRHHLSSIFNTCETYFYKNPYDKWFKRFDALISLTGSSYYSAIAPACHLDLVPFATGLKWGNLETKDQAVMVQAAGDSLGKIVAASGVRVLVLNGRAVIDYFNSSSRSEIKEEPMQEWNLLRNDSKSVSGFAYHGVVRRISGVTIDRDVLILGFNHNLQSSFGVTREIASSIRQWIADMTRKSFQ